MISHVTMQLASAVEHGRNILKGGASSSKQVVECARQLRTLAGTVLEHVPSKAASKEQNEQYKGGWVMFQDLSAHTQDELLDDESSNTLTLKAWLQVAEHVVKMRKNYPNHWVDKMDVENTCSDIAADAAACSNTQERRREWRDKLGEDLPGILSDLSTALASVYNSMVTSISIYLAFLAVIFQGATTASSRFCNQVWAPLCMYGFGAVIMSVVLAKSLQRGSILATQANTLIHAAQQFSGLSLYYKAEAYRAQIWFGAKVEGGKGTLKRNSLIILLGFTLAAVTAVSMASAVQLYCFTSA